MKKKTLIIIISIIFILMILFIVLFNLSRDSYSPQELSANQSLDPDVMNIALLGIDERSSKDTDSILTDTIIIASINKKTSEIKLTSVLRDTFVFIATTEKVVVMERPYTENVKDPYNYAKLNTAYDLGGAGTVMKTLNMNFDLNIEEYILFDFSSLREIVDGVDGVTVDIPDAKFLNQLNDLIYTFNRDENRNDPLIEDVGEQKLNGSQALAYVRSRFTDSDPERTNRQREVISQILDKLRSEDIGTVAKVFFSVYPSVKTSLSLREIYDLAKIGLNSGSSGYESESIPTKAFQRTGAIYANSYIFPYPLINNVQYLHEFIYGKTVDPSQDLTDISEEIIEIYDEESSLGPF